MLGRKPVEPQLLLGTLQVWLGLRHQPGHMRDKRALHRRLFARFCQTRGGILQHQRVHIVAAGRATRQQRFAGQRGQLRQAGPGHNPCRRAIKAAAKDGQAAQHLLLGVRQQLPGGGQQRAQAAVPRGTVVLGAGGQIEIGGDFGFDLGAGKQRHPRRRQLDTERMTRQLAA